MFGHFRAQRRQHSSEHQRSCLVTSAYLKYKVKGMRAPDLGHERGVGLEGAAPWKKLEEAPHAAEHAIGVCKVQTKPGGREGDSVSGAPT
eukprot:1786244-Pyramimonas_sp.AAC.1